MGKRPLRYFAAIFSLMLLLSAVFCAPAGAQIQPTIRVWLKKPQIEDALRIEVHGAYMLESGAMIIGDGAVLDVVLRDNQLVLHTGQVAVVMGSSIKLLRCEGDAPGGLTLNGNGLYEGDLALDVDSGVIRAILHIDIEDYLLGVVPFEMGDSFPLEALKAQAITARTYALRKSGSSGAYDVEDTTNDQAYYGRTTYSPLSEQAVRETQGLCGTYRGKLAQCFYSASNGGQTELGQHVWPTSDPDAYGYMDMREDPYDLENDASVVKRFTLAKKPGNAGVTPALHSALVAELAEQLASLGYAVEDDLVRFDEFLAVEAITPKYEGDSRLMTQMRFELRVSVRECLFRETAHPAETQATPAAVKELTPQPMSSATPHPTATPAYGPYTPLEQTFSVTLPIFTTVEKAMGLSINVSQNELITVYDIGSAFMIESRRYGHGVGMSQRGAQQMAAKYGMTYEQILSFYYPGMEIVSYSLERRPLPTVNAELMATPAPTPSPTPRPTLMPVTANGLQKGEYVAVVTNISEDSSLNLRETPSLSADVLRRLYKDQKLIVMSVTQDGWAHVRTDVIEGYVRSEYLQTAEAP